MEENIHDASQFDETEDQNIIKVIGVGGGGGNAVNYMYHQNIPNVNFVVCNTDQGALQQSPVAQKLILGYEITKGRGAGNKPEVGKMCAEASTEEIKKLFDDQTEMVFITAGMGGGTGTGAAPIVAQIAKDSGMLTLGIITVPFLFEGKKKILKAIEGAKEMQKHVDALLVINNENLVELYPDLDFFNAMNKADDTLANAARSISEIITDDCYINVDFQDVKTVLKDSGTAIISSAMGEGENRLSMAIKNALHSPLLKKHDVKTAKRLLLKFSCSKDAANPLKSEELREISNFTEQLPTTIDVKWGVKDDPTLGDKVKVTILAAGFDVTLDGNMRITNGQDEPQEGVLFFEPADEINDGPSITKKEKKTSEVTVDEKNIAAYYGKETVFSSVQNKNRMRYAVLKPGQFDDDDIIHRMERQTALNRDSKFLQEINSTKEKVNVPGTEGISNPEEAGMISF